MSQMVFVQEFLQGKDHPLHNDERQTINLIPLIFFLMLSVYLKQFNLYQLIGKE